MRTVRTYRNGGETRAPPPARRPRPPGGPHEPRGPPLAYGSLRFESGRRLLPARAGRTGDHRSPTAGWGSNPGVGFSRCPASLVTGKPLVGNGLGNRIL